MPVALITHPACFDHDTGPPHPERTREPVIPVASSRGSATGANVAARSDAMTPTNPTTTAVALHGTGSAAPTSHPPIRRRIDGRVAAEPLGSSCMVRL